MFSDAAASPPRTPARLPFERFQRYATAARVVETWREGAPALRVLEIGAGAQRHLESFLAADVVCLDLWSHAGAAPGRVVRGDAVACPFRDRAFDVVVAVDVLEHLPSPQHAPFLAEAMRLAARGVVIAAPFRSPAVAACEARLSAYYRDLHGRDFPRFAAPHAHGLPELDEVVAQIRARGWHTEVWGTGNLALWAKLARAHLYVDSEPGLRELLGDADEFYNSTLARGDSEPPVYSHFIVCAPDAAGLRALARARPPAQRPHSRDLLRLHEHLDRLYEAGERTRGRHARRGGEPQDGHELAQQASLAALEAQVRTRDARLTALEAQARRNDAALAELHARASEKDAALAELGRQLAGQQGRRASAVRAACRTLWSRIAAAAGAGFIIARAAGGLWRSRQHAMRLAPFHDLVADGDGFRSLGDDPQFILYSDRRRLPRAWVVISFAVELRGQWLSPKLYVDDGRGFSEERSFALPVRAGRRVECMIGLPYRVRALRLDPLAAPGRFVLHDVRIREVGLLQLASALLPQVRSAAGRPRELMRRAGIALGMLRSGGSRALTENLMARDREVSDYQDWIDAYDTPTETDRSLMRRHIDSLARRPLLSVLMSTSDTPEVWLRRAIDSVRRQLYPHWELCIADDASAAPHVRRILEEYRGLDSRIKIIYRPRRGQVSAALNTALRLAAGDFVALLDHEDELAERALYLMAVELEAHPAADALYSDEDKITAHGQRFHPYFKPDWNPDLFRAQNLVTRLCVCRTERVHEVGGFRSGHEGAHDWDLVMRIVDRTPGAQIRHVPHVLYHWRAAPGSTALASVEKNYASAPHYRTLAAHFGRRRMRVEIQPVSGLCWRVRYPLPQPLPLVSVIIPTRDHAALLRRCLSSLRRRSAYPRLQIVILDNQSTDRATLAYLTELAAEPNVTVVRHDAPFNYSALNNAGARHARGDVLMLLNNDVEAISPGAIEEMVSQACRPEIGAVGAMLYYPNDTIQHAGVILGLGTSGIAGHAYAFRPRGYAGQIGRALLTQNVSAVTAACMVLRRQVFEEVGGFDETNLAIAYNDLDLCLRIGARGYRNLWTPHAQFYHLESASRGYDDTPAKRERFHQEIEYMRKRWGRVLRSDPAYNPNLSLDGESFTLAFPPRTPKPWLDVAEAEPDGSDTGDASQADYRA